MSGIFQWVRSVVFLFLILLWMTVLGIVFTPYAIVSKRGALKACKIYAGSIIWLARWMVGIRGEVRGPVPTGEVMIAAKHQSFFDIMLIFDAVPHAKFIMKRELLWTPFIGLYAKRLGCVPVNRGKRGVAIAKMVQDVAKEFSDPGQLVIYPQGTRVPPGEKKPYKVGSSVLYENLNQPCVPVATNVGLFWPKKSLLLKPGRAVVEFLEPLPSGMERNAFMQQLEEMIEAKSDALMREVGFDPNA